MTTVLFLNFCNVTFWQASISSMCLSIDLGFGISIIFRIVISMWLCRSYISCPPRIYSIILGNLCQLSAKHLNLSDYCNCLPGWMPEIPFFNVCYSPNFVAPQCFRDYNIVINLLWLKINIIFWPLQNTNI